MFPQRRAFISSDAPTHEWRAKSREASPAQVKQKGKPCTHQAQLWQKQMEIWLKSSHKRHWKGCRMEQPDLKAVIISGKIPWTLDQKLKAVPTPEKGISLGKQVPMPAAGWAALPWTASPRQKHCYAESVEQQKTTGGGKSLPWTWCKARNMLRVVGLCWRTWDLKIHLTCSPLHQPKAGEITTLLEWFCTSAKEQMGATNIPHGADTGTPVQPILPSPPHSCSLAPGPKPPHCSHTCWHHCWLSHCANRTSE